jgi:adenine-specific DNA-methyltransferase
MGGMLRMIDFMSILENILREDGRLIAEDGSLLKNRAYELAMKMDTVLLNLIFNNEMTKEHFFKKIDDFFVFDKVEFGWVLSSKEFLPDNYTKYSNKIGLVNQNSDSIVASEDVTLVWPYKDCILEGGQTKEEEIRDEIYYNETLAPNQVNRLLYPKVFTNAVKYTAEGVSPITEINDKDNLIIKGNNLLVLSPLLKRYEGRIKCIYIDPPYNTGNDGFKYNDNFNHSTWLTFMKNRLSLAKRLLKDDGFIFIEIDTNEMHYLKVLCDEIFGRENFINDIVWKRRGGSANPQNRLNNVTESILWYSKTQDYTINHIFTLDDENTQKYIQDRFTNADENGRKFMKSPLQSPNYRENLIYEYKGYKPPKKGWSISREVMEEWDREGRLWFPENKDNNIVRKIYLDEYKGQPISNLWTDIKVINPMAKERLDFDGQKPEALLQRIIELSTNEGDIVLDYHLGTGTTCAVAHKLKRQYIGVEQMDYINAITLPRLQKVIESDNIGISESANWAGGGSFVYCELKELNEKYITKIQEASTEKELFYVWREIQDTGFISHYISPKEINIEVKEFKDLSFEEKKKLFIALVDKNMLYVNLCDIDDEDFNISEEDKAFTNSFYGRD